MVQTRAQVLTEGYNVKFHIEDLIEHHTNNKSTDEEWAIELFAYLCKPECIRVLNNNVKWNKCKTAIFLQMSEFKRKFTNDKNFSLLSSIYYLETQLTQCR